jgi:hypothetical protein
VRRALAGLFVIALALPLGGCVEIVFGIGGLLSSGISIYQRWEDRGAQTDQTEEIRKLRQEIRRLLDTVLLESDPDRKAALEEELADRAVDLARTVAGPGPL